MGESKDVISKVGINKDKFYQSKYEYFRKFNKWVIIFSALSEIAYFVSDCEIFGRFLRPVC